MSDNSENWRAYEQLISFEKRADMTYAIRLDKNVLNRKLRDHRVKDLKVITIAFAGETAIGKSTLVEGCRVNIMSKHDSVFSGNVSASMQGGNSSTNIVDDHIVVDGNVLYPSLSNIERFVREHKEEREEHSSDESDTEFVDHAELNDNYSKATTAECQQNQQQDQQKSSPQNKGENKKEGGGGLMKGILKGTKRMMGKKKRAAAKVDQMQIKCSQDTSNSTQGIWIVGPFFGKIGDEIVAIYIVDTQGTGDGKNLHFQTQILTLKFCSVFALNYGGQSRSIKPDFFMDLSLVLECEKCIDRNTGLGGRTVRQQSNRMCSHRKN